MPDSQGRASFQRSLADALGTADLRRLQLNWTAASVGSRTFFIVLAVYAYNEGGAAAVGVAALARMVPAGLAAPLAGAIVDRRSRRDVLLGSVIGRALPLGAIGAAVAAEARSRSCSRSLPSSPRSRLRTSGTGRAAAGPRPDPAAATGSPPGSGR